MKKLYQQFSKAEKRSLVVLLIIIIISGLTQVVGIASVFPFISVATNPEIIESNVYLFQLKTVSGIESKNNFLVALGLLVLLMMILSNALVALTTWLTMRFVVSNTHKFAFRLMQRYLSESYEFHLKRNSAELIKNITFEVSRVVSGGIMSALQICSSSVTVLFILTLLIIADPKIAFMVAFIIGFTYFLIYHLIRVKLSSLGKRAGILFGQRFKNINESLGGIKDLMVLQRESYYLKQLSSITDDLSDVQIKNRTLADLPKYIVETIAFGGILAITIYLIHAENNTSDVMPIVAMYGFAAIRLMPAMQLIFKSAATLKHDISAVDVIYEDLVKAQKKSTDILYSGKSVITKMPFQKKLSLEQISFSYDLAERKALNNINIEIEKNTSVGIVGSSGSGKSTLIDIILGLLDPDLGQIMVDDKELNHLNMQSWKSDIGYVPQSIFLSDSTVAENIAFGIPKEEMNMEAVINAAKMANLHDFIESDLEKSYETIVGERGIRLSGGQRQRIGIARALYNNPGVLIFDEATSALDNTSEKAIIDAVNELRGKITMIMIAHRISTVVDCDKLVWLESGNVKAVGDYLSLMKTNNEFKAFVSPS
jgi:ABC-type multidrug transport system fused ATPase/permease subunit